MSAPNGRCHGHHPSYPSPNAFNSEAGISPTTLVRKVALALRKAGVNLASLNISFRVRWGGGSPTYEVSSAEAS